MGLIAGQWIGQLQGGSGGMTEPQVNLFRAAHGIVQAFIEVASTKIGRRFSFENIHRIVIVQKTGRQSPCGGYLVRSVNAQKFFHQIDGPLQIQTKTGYADRPVNGTVRLAAFLHVESERLEYLADGRILDIESQPAADET